MNARRLIFGAIIGSALVALTVGFRHAGASPPDGSQVAGHLSTRGGATKNFVSVGKYAWLHVWYGPENKESTIPLAGIRQIIFGEEDAAVIAMRDGRKVEARRAWFHRRGRSRTSYDFEYSYFDDIRRVRKTAYVARRDLSKITFDSPVGRFRRCPHCKGLWPSSYFFCPHDGTRCVWGEAAGSLTTGARRIIPMCCPKCMSVHAGRALKCRACGQKLVRAKTDTFCKTIDYFLGRAGIDPASKEAAAARQFSKKWLSPLASEDEILRALGNTVKQATGVK